MTEPVADAPLLTSSNSEMKRKTEEALAVYHSHNKHEKLILGVYVDNLQITHSHPIDQKGTKIHPFMQCIQDEWDVED